MNPKQKLFVQEYLKDLNGKQAAIRAGYSEKSAEVQASQLLSLPKVAQAVKSAMDKRAQKTEVTQERIINELKRIAFSGMKNVARWGPSGVDMKGSEELSEDDAASVQEVSETTNQHGGSLKIKQYDKVRALELLGKHLGMFTDRLEITESDRPLKDLTDAELDARLRGDAK